MTTVLHVNWSSGSLWLWGERSSAGERAQGAVEAERHPGAIDGEELRELAASLGASTSAPAGTISVALPTARGKPLASPHLAHLSGHGVHEDEVVSMAAWRTPALPIDAAGAARTLEQLEVAAADRADGPTGVALSASATFFAATARLARSLLAEQRFVPMAWQTPTGELTASWRPWLSDEATAAKVAALLRSMPPAARAAVDDAQHQAWPVLERALDRLVDASCRRTLESEGMIEAIEGRDAGADAHVALLTGLLGSGEGIPATERARQTLVKQVRQWIGRLDDRGGEVGWRLCLRVLAPEEREDGGDGAGEAWSVTFHIESMEGERVVLDADEIWGMSGGAVTVDGRRLEAPRETLLSELGRASRLYQPLERALEEAEPTELELTTVQAYAFLREFRPLLIEQGVTVEAPEWWDSPAARLGVRLEIDSGEAPMEGPGSPTRSALGLAALVDYRWRIAVGDTTLSMVEFEKLASRREPLVKIGGKWVEIRPEDCRTALEFLKKNPGGKAALGEALRLAFGAESAGGGVVSLGLSATGWVGRVFGDASDAERIVSIDQPGAFVGALRPYQLKGLSWLAFLERHGLGACLADDMGLGKTIQVLALLLHERAEGGARPGPTLLVAPTSVIRNWQREASRFAPQLNVLLHHGPERPQGEALVAGASASDVVVTTYALAHRDHEQLAKVAWRRVVLDEAQNIKNPAAKQAQSLRSMPAGRRVALTGTPVENRLSELWSIMEFCNHGYLGPLAEFRRRFSVPIERRRDQHRARQLRALVQPFVLRRLKSDPTVTTDLPEKIQTKELVHLTAEQAALYEQTVKSMLAQVDQLEGMRRRGAVLAALIKLKQICNHPSSLPEVGEKDVGGPDAPPNPARSGKCERLIEMLEEVLAARDQALIFTQFRRMGHHLSKMVMQHLDREALFLHGGTPAKTREQMVERFQKGDGSSPIFILSLKAGGLGMNLTAANHVFHFDRWWNPAVENQATDRAHRIGQTRTVHVHKFIVAGTLEERIDQMIEQKTELAESIIASGERWLTELSTSQLRDLLTLREGAVVEVE